MKEHLTSLNVGAFFLSYNPSYGSTGSSLSPIPSIYHLNSLNESVPSGFNAVKITLDASVSAALDWSLEKIAAKRYIEQGLAIFWELDFGLFTPASLALSDQTQYLTLSLSIEHFRDSIWREFSLSSLAVAVYQGPADFSHHFLWHEEHIRQLQGWLKDRFQGLDELIKESAIFESASFIHSFDDIDPHLLAMTAQGQGLLALFCRDTVVEYLQLLTNRLSDEIPLFVLLDASQVQSPLLCTQLLNKERLGRMHLAFIPGVLPAYAFAWEPSKTLLGSISREITQKVIPAAITTALCLPSMTMCQCFQYEGINQALIALEKHNIPFRIIAEVALSTEWDGLDYLLVSPQGLSPQGMRKLQGFCAAGGTVVTLANPLNLAQEISFEDWLRAQV